MFPHLYPGTGAAYTALRDLYIALETNLSAKALAKWCDEVLGILTNAFADEGLNVEYRVSEV